MSELEEGHYSGDGKWSPEIEQILVMWSEKALCYRAMHQLAYHKYTNKYHNYIIPIIVLSTVTGTANFGLQSIVPTGYENMASMIIGGFNLFTGLLTTLLNFFKYAELKQSHESAITLWHKYYRTLSTEIALENNKRQDSKKFFHWCKTEYDKILDHTPIIPKAIIKQFRISNKKIIQEKKVHIPEIVLPVASTQIYQDYVYEREKRSTLVKLIKPIIGCDGVVIDEIEAEVEIKNDEPKEFEREEKAHQ